MADTSEPLNVGVPIILIPSVVLPDRPPVSVARIVTVLLPAVVGVPVMAPVPAFRLSPAGKPVAA